MCNTDFAKVFPLLAQNQGWEKLLSYYQNPSLAKPDNGMLSPMNSWTEMKAYLEELTIKFPSEDHKALLATILALLSDEHNNLDDENMQYFLKIPAKQREALIATKLIGISHMLKDFIISGAFHQLTEREKPLFMSVYGQDIMIPLLKLFGESQARQSKRIDKMAKEEDSFDENDPQFKKDQKETQAFQEFMMHYMIARNKALQLKTEEAQN